MLGSALSSSRICRLRANWSSVCGENVRPRRASAIDCRVQRPSRRKKREAQEILDKLIERAKRDYVSPYHLAIVCTGMGDREQAFQWLEKAYQERAHYLVHIKWEPLRESSLGPALSELVATHRPHQVISPLSRLGCSACPGVHGGWGPYTSCVLAVRSLSRIPADRWAKLIRTPFGATSCCNALAHQPFPGTLCVGVRVLLVHRMNHLDRPVLN